MTEESNWEIRNGKEIWSKALNERVVTCSTPEMAEWIDRWSALFHPMNDLGDVAREVERYVAGRFAIPPELRKRLTAAVERVYGLGEYTADEPAT